MGISMQPVAEVVVDAAPKEAKRKPVRRDPEKRRLQNLQAQRKYREKMKQRFDRLDQLESMVASVTGTQPPTQAITPPDTASSATDSISTQNTTPLSEDNLTPEDVYQAPLLSSLDSATMEMLPWTPVPDTISSWDPLAYMGTDDLLDMGQPAMKATEWPTPASCNDSTKSDPTTDNMSLQLLRTNQCSIARPEPTTALANPYVNGSIAFREINPLAALMENAYMIGVSEQMFNDPTANSPFYRPSAAGAKNSEFVKGVLNIFKTLKPDLRPMEQQVLIAHHPGIDVLPFPTFRKNVLDHHGELCIGNDEGCYDMQHGMICWGTAGLSKADRQSSKASSGMPWDSRSWEAKPWFLRKYWDLLGGEDGELVIQSEWWRRSRGDETNIWMP